MLVYKIKTVVTLRSIIASACGFPEMSRYKIIKTVVPPLTLHQRYSLACFCCVTVVRLYLCVYVCVVTCVCARAYVTYFKVYHENTEQHARLKLVIFQ